MQDYMIIHSKEKHSINHAFKMIALAFNHACKDKCLGIQVHFQNKIKEKPTSNMVNDKTSLQQYKLVHQKWMKNVKQPCNEKVSAKFGLL